MKEPDYRGIAALVIAACAALGIFILVPVAVLFGGRVGGSGKDILVALGGALIGSAATYMGMKYTQPVDKP
jgi:hypothetical protein